jgi:hypothetical protein
MTRKSKRGQGMPNEEASKYRIKGTKPRERGKPNKGTKRTPRSDPPPMHQDRYVPKCIRCGFPRESKSFVVCDNCSIDRRAA